MPRRKVLVHAYDDIGNGSLLPIHFQAATPRSSGEIGGFFVGSDSRLLLWNRSPAAGDLEILATNRHGNRFSARTTVDPESVLSF